MIRRTWRRWRGWRVVREHWGALPRLGARALDPLADLLWEQAGGALIAIDRSGRIVRANAASRDLAAPLEVARGTPVLDLFAPETRDALWADILSSLHGSPPKPPFRACLAVTEPAGDAPMVAVTVVPLAPGRSRWKSGRQSPARAQGALLRLVDLRRQRELEAQLSQAQKQQALGQFAGGIAHDFNNLLAAILGAAETIAERSGLVAEVAEDAAQIRAAAERGSQLVRQLLAFGRQQTLQPRRVGVPAAIADLSGMLRRLLGSTVRLELECEGVAERQVVQADPVQLDQVLVNLAVNARDAMAGGGVLRITSRQVVLHRARSAGADSVPAGRWVTIEVRDTGAGMPPEVLSRVFDPFFTTRREQGGSGLGLSTVHGIVRQSGGFISLESTPGEGTCARIWLRSIDGMAELRIPRAPAVATRVRGAFEAAGRTVLLVDDEEPVRRLAARALARQGWRILAAGSAEAAVVALDAEPADAPPLAAMVSDMVMPGIDGAALVEIVRARAGMGRLPALLVSGYSEMSLRTALADRPAMAFLPKPYSLGELVSRVATLVERAGG